MKIKQILGELIPVFDGESLKKHVAKKVLRSDQFSNGVVNIHRHDLKNVGDFYCAPYLYFEELQGQFLDIYGIRNKSPKIRSHWIKTVVNNDLVIGGGGLLNLPHFGIQMKLFEALAKKGKKIVIWGPGHNAVDYHNFNANKRYNVDLNAFGLVGVRDFNLGFEWVPCVSCMNEIFDRPYNEEQEFGILMGKKSAKRPDLAKKLAKYPLSSNTTNLEEMISFIGKSHILVTDSYHAMYWGILMEKKVIAIPTTSKFFDFKYKVVISSYDSFEDDLKKPGFYTGVLEECRDINRKFADRVFDYLNL